MTTIYQQYFKIANLFKMETLFLNWGSDVVFPTIFQNNFVFVRKSNVFLNLFILKCGYYKLEGLLKLLF